MSKPRRIHRTVRLVPASGDRFQPTGFPDLGAATFQRPFGEDGWLECLHVESPQSMANRFEDVGWDAVAFAPVPDLAGVPYVRVVNAEGRPLTSSRTEPHRLASGYIMDGQVGDTGQTGYQWLPGFLGLEEGQPLDHQRVAKAVFALDPFSLIHGVFFAQRGGGWSRQPKIARALSAFIDATDVRPAISGGVKTDFVSTAGGNAETGYGMVPHQRVEYTARRIEAHVTVDLQQIRGYGLGEAETELLEAIVDFELASFFTEEGMRLRTACEFKIAEEQDQDQAPLPTIAEACERLSRAVKDTSGSLGEVTTVTYGGTDKSARKRQPKTKPAEA